MQHLDKHSNSRIIPGFTTHFGLVFLISTSSRLIIPRFLSTIEFVCPLRLLPCPLDYNFPISSRPSNFMFSSSIHMFWTSRFICFQLRFLYIPIEFELEIFDFEFEILDYSWFSFVDCVLNVDCLAPLQKYVRFWL